MGMVVLHIKVDKTLFSLVNIFYCIVTNVEDRGSSVKVLSSKKS